MKENIKENIKIKYKNKIKIEEILNSLFFNRL
jgi:hypothetical protein